MGLFVSKEFGMLTQERVRELLDYDEGSGEFTWRVTASPTSVVGSVTGCLDESNGYIYIGISGSGYRANRLAWLYSFGYFPESEVDHRNRVRSDNRLSNLREVSSSCNSKNSGVRESSLSGVKGVSYDRSRGKWRADICVSGVCIYLGRSSYLVGAVALRLAAEQFENWEDCDDDSSAHKFIKEYTNALRK